MKKDSLLNEQIREKEIRLIGDDGEQFGIVDTKEAMRMAEEKELDLVMISPNAVPPVCKIMDYGKHLYEQTRKVKEARKNQKIVNLKEVRLSPTIEENDIQIKANRAIKFLQDEDKVKVTVRFRGREAEHSYKGKEILDIFISKVGDVCVVEKPAKLEGRNMILILAPKKA